MSRQPCWTEGLDAKRAWSPADCRISQSEMPFSVARHARLCKWRSQFAQTPALACQLPDLLMGVQPCKARHPYLDTILNGSEQILIGHPRDFGEPGSRTQEMLARPMGAPFAGLVVTCFTARAAKYSPWETVWCGRDVAWSAHSSPVYAAGCSDCHR